MKAGKLSLQTSAGSLGLLQLWIEAVAEWVALQPQGWNTPQRPV